MPANGPAEHARTQALAQKAGAWVDLGLSLPLFLGYHLGVVFLEVRNASDLVTGELLRLTAGSLPKYLLVTLAIGAAFAGAFVRLGRGQAFRPVKFAQIAVEAVVYAFALRVVGSYVVGRLFAGRVTEGGFPGLVMSLGAGFYEELSYRVLLFAGVGRLLGLLLPRAASGATRLALGVAWAVLCAALFSGAHYVGSLADDFQLQSFVFRWVLGLMLTLIFWARGFAAAAWTHALYDAWVLVL
jgi:hypothetical protein